MWFVLFAHFNSDGWNMSSDLDQSDKIRISEQLRQSFDLSSNVIINRKFKLSGWMQFGWFSGFDLDSIWMDEI